MTVLKGGLFKSTEASVLHPGSITGAVITNAGTIGAEGANLTINGDVTNAKGTLDANNATLEIDGAVNGGKATIEGTGEIVFGGPSSADVRFGPSSDAILKLENPSTFTGTVFGLPTGAYLDLTNIDFANNPTISYSSKTHLLTVTDSVAGVTDTITLKHVSGSFSAQSDGNGGTLIADTSPPNPVAVCHDQDSFVFAPHLGDNPVSNVNAHNDALDLPHSEFAELAALMNWDHHDGALDLSAHDANDHAAAVMAQHTHHFLCDHTASTNGMGAAVRWACRRTLISMSCARATPPTDYSNQVSPPGSCGNAASSHLNGRVGLSSRKSVPAGKAAGGVIASSALIACSSRLGHVTPSVTWTVLGAFHLEHDLQRQRHFREVLLPPRRRA